MQLFQHVAFRSLALSAADGPWAAVGIAWREVERTDSALADRGGIPALRAFQSACERRDEILAAAQQAEPVTIERRDPGPREHHPGLWRRGPLFRAASTLRSGPWRDLDGLPEVAAA